MTLISVPTFDPAARMCSGTLARRRGFRSLARTLCVTPQDPDEMPSPTIGTLCIGRELARRDGVPVLNAPMLSFVKLTNSMAVLPFVRVRSGRTAAPNTAGRSDKRTAAPCPALLGALGQPGSESRSTKGTVHTWKYGKES